METDNEALAPNTKTSELKLKGQLYYRSFDSKILLIIFIYINL